MWFLASVLLLWGTTVMLARWDDHILPAIIQWAWWTASLYVCAVAALAEPFRDLHAKVMGMFGYSLVVIYYTTVTAVYTSLVPVDAGRPDLWPTVFLTVNLMGPLALITLGCLSPAVQRGDS